MTVKPAIYTFTIAGLIICTLAACTEKKKEADLRSGGKPNILNAEGYVVKPMPFQTNYVASGSLLPNEEIKILPEISGRVTNISFTEGGYVSKGQLLVTLYNQD